MVAQRRDWRSHRTRTIFRTAGNGGHSGHGVLYEWQL